METDGRLLRSRIRVGRVFDRYAQHVTHRRYAFLFLFPRDGCIDLRPLEDTN